MGKAKRAAKKEHRAAMREARREAEEAAKKQAIQRKIVLAVVAISTFSGAAIAYWGFDQGQLTGVILLVGALVFLLYGLATVGGAVKPRDRGRAGSIDFGRRN